MEQVGKNEAYRHLALIANSHLAYVKEFRRVISEAKESILQVEYLDGLIMCCAVDKMLSLALMYLRISGVKINDKRYSEWCREVPSVPSDDNGLVRRDLLARGFRSGSMWCKLAYGAKLKIVLDLGMMEAELATKLKYIARYRNIAMHGVSLECEFKNTSTSRLLRDSWWSPSTPQISVSPPQFKPFLLDVDSEELLFAVAASINRFLNVQTRFQERMTAALEYIESLPTFNDGDWYNGIQSGSAAYKTLPYDLDDKLLGFQWSVVLEHVDRVCPA